MSFQTTAITKADKDSVSLLLPLSITTFSDTFAPFNKKEDMDRYKLEEMSEEKLREELNDRNNLFLLAWHNDELAGYAKIRVNQVPDALKNSNPIEIERLYVLEQYHCKKVGAALMQYALNHAIENRHHVVWLGVWEHNHKAINFYKRWGFEFFGTHPFVLGGDTQTDLLMKKPLPTFPNGR